MECYLVNHERRSSFVGTNAGVISSSWYEDCLQDWTEADVENWFRHVTNKPCEIGYLTVWDGRRWLRQSEIDEICQKIDEGI